MRCIFLTRIKDAVQIKKHVALYLKYTLVRLGFLDLQAFDLIANVGYHSARKELQAWLEKDRALQQIVDAHRAR